jgi:hypothetical protein
MCHFLSPEWPEWGPSQKLNVRRLLFKNFLLCFVFRYHGTRTMQELAKEVNNIHILKLTSRIRIPPLTITPTIPEDSLTHKHPTTEFPPS